MGKVLIVEDEPVLSRVLRNRFEEQGWQVVVAGDGKEAMNFIKSKKFNLVLLDLILPKKDGFEVLQEVRSNPEWHDLPILVLSNLGGDEDIKRALKLGADDYFVKTQHPISEVLERVKIYQSNKK